MLPFCTVTEDDQGAFIIEWNYNPDTQDTGDRSFYYSALRPTVNGSLGNESGVNYGSGQHTGTANPYDFDTDFYELFIQYRGYDVPTNVETVRHKCENIPYVEPEVSDMTTFPEAMGIAIAFFLAITIISMFRFRS